MTIIEAENLTYKYDEENALDGVSFTVEEGEHVALIGHNGSGKSTLAKALAGLLLESRDDELPLKVFSLQMESKNLSEIRKHIGLVFQNPDNQFVGSSVRDDIAFGLENRQIPREKMEAIIQKYAKETGMEDYLDSAPENLSGGQKQRVAIAGVLAMEPDLIIFDEATSMLDPKGKKEILSLIEKMKEEKKNLTILSITHDVEEAYQADRVLVLDKGRLVLSGTPDEVFAQEDILAATNLALPFIPSLKKELMKLGIQVPSSIRTREELEDFLCQ